MMNKGKFITFEGGEGSGKSTQAKLLYDYLKKQNVDVVLTREPGGVESAEIIRNILVTGDADKFLPKTELLLHFAARVEHVNKLIIPALEKGKVVICDRFVDSTIAYQAYGHGLDKSLIYSLAKNFINNIEPDLTFIIDIDFKKGIQRSRKRLSKILAKPTNLENRYEKMSNYFHDRVREGFLKISENSRRFHKIYGDDSIENVNRKIIQICESKLSL